MQYHQIAIMNVCAIINQCIVASLFLFKKTNEYVLDKNNTRH